MNKIILHFLKQNKCDGMLLHNSYNRRWFLNFNSSFGFLLIGKSKAIFITDSRYFLAAKKKIKKSNIEVWCISSEKNHDLISLLKSAKEKLNISKVLIEEEYTNLSEYKLIKKIWPENNIESFISRNLRTIKNNKELNDLQIAANIIVDTVKWLWKVIKPGMTEIEVAKLISVKIISLGGEKNSFDPIVAAGINGANPHHKPSDYVIKEGDMITVDLGCYYNGYASDMTRTFVLGKTCNTPELIDIYKLVYKAQTTGIQAAKNKINGVDLDNVCRTIIDSTKYRGLFGHGTGHGVGLEVHELPNVNMSNNKMFENNNVITIEPGIYKKGVGGVRIEDTIVIRNNNPIILTAKCPKTLKYVNNWVKN